MSKTDLIHAYRHLYRSALQAVQYSTPARYTARDLLRAGFRQRDGVFDKEAAKRTVWFFKAAAKETGLEHKIVRNLLKTAYHRKMDHTAKWKAIVQQMKDGSQRKIQPDDEFIQKTAFSHYDMTVAMLNKTMGLCLR